MALFFYLLLIVLLFVWIVSEQDWILILIDWFSHYSLTGKKKYPLTLTSQLEPKHLLGVKLLEILTCNPNGDLLEDMLKPELYYKENKKVDIDNP